MARAGTAKTKLVDGQRIDISTGEAFNGAKTDFAKLSVPQTNIDTSGITPNINADELNVRPVTTNTKTQPVGVDELISSATDIIQTPVTSTKDEQALRAVEDEKIRLMEELGGEQQFRQQQEKKLGVNQFENELNDIYQDILNKGASLRQGLANEEGKPIAMEFITGRQAQMKRLAAAELEGLKAVFDATNARLLTAESRVQKAVDLKYEPIRAALEMQKELIDINRDRMTRGEKKRAEEKEAQLAALQLQINRAQEEETSAKSFILQALSNGASPSTASQLMKQVTNGEAGLNDVIGQLGYFAMSPSQRITLNNAAIEANKDVSGDWGSVINGINSLNLGAENSKQIKKSISSSLETENYQAALAELENAVEGSLTGEVKTKYANSRNDYQIMKRMQDAIQAYSDAGGDLGILKGNAQRIEAKLGLQSTGNSELAKLNAYLLREFQTYRLNMTGAAFSPAESREYEAVNPRTTASLDLNLSTISGALQQLSNRVEGTVTARVPDAQQLYDITNQFSADEVNLLDQTVEGGASVESFYQ